MLLACALVTLHAMTDDGQKIARREIADTLVRALERRHELLDVIVESEDYDAAVEAIASMLGTSAAGGEAVLRMSFDRLTKVSRRRIAAELEDLNHELSFTMGEPQASPGSSLLLRPFSAASDRDIFAARTDDVRAVFGELASGEVNVRIWIHPAFRKQGYGTAALRKSRSEMAAYFPAVPLVVRAPAAGA